LNGLYKEKKHNLTNSVSFVLSHRGKFGILIFYVDGEINLIAQNKNNFFEKSDIEELILESNQFIQLCNKDNYYSENNISLNQLTITKLLNVTLKIEIPKYLVKDLMNIMKHFYSYLLILNENITNKDVLEIYYLKKNDCKNKKYISSFIAYLDSLKLSDVKIKELIQFRFNLTSNQSDEEYSDYNRLKEQKKHIRHYDNDVIIKIFQKSDLIHCEIIGCSTENELNFLQNLFLFIFNVYYQKIEYKKDDINLCKWSKEKQKLIKNYFDFINDEEDEEDEEDEDDEEDEEDDEDDTDESIGKLEDSDSSQSGGGDISQSGGGYNNYRYYMNRLSKYDKDLINTDSKYLCNTAVQDKSYARSCPGPNKPDNQPIAILKKDLDELDRKTGMKNKGVSYKSALHVEGRDPEIKYICPKFWDVKNEIPLAPDKDKVDKELSEKEYQDKIEESWIHPITKENFRDDIMNHDLSTEDMKDTDKYILNRSGRPKGKKDKDSTWDRTLIDMNGKKGKYDIDKYNVTMIPNVHPDGFDIPCCGMSPVYKYWHIENSKKSFKFELLDIIEKEEGVFYLLSSEKPSIVQKELDKQKIKEKFTKNQIVLPSVMLNNSPDLNRILYSFPLDNKTKGYLTEDLLNYFSMKEKEPYIIKDNVKDSKSRKPGLYRVGIKQNHNSFLSCLVTSIYNYKIGDWITTLIDNIETDLFTLNKNNDLSYIANGNFINCFESKDILNDKYTILNLFSEKIALKGYPKMIKDRFLNGEIDLLMKNLENKKKNLENYHLLTMFKKYSAIRNFINYLKSDEYKKEEYIIPILNEISQLENNVTFKFSKEKMNKLSIIVFEEKNEKIKLVEPLGKFKKDDVSHYLLIYKCGDQYEPIFYYDKNNIHHQFISQNTAPVICDKINQLLETDDISQDMNDKEYPTRSRIIEIMKKKNNLYKKDKNEYYNLQNHIIYLTYTRKKDNSKLLIPIKPQPMKKSRFVNYISYEEHQITDKIPRVSLKIIYNLLLFIDNYDIDCILEDYNQEEKKKIFLILNEPIKVEEKIEKLQQIKKKNEELYQSIIDIYSNPRYKRYLDKQEKIIVNDKNICLYLSLSLKIPILLKRVALKEKDIQTTTINEYQYSISNNLQFDNEAIIEDKKKKNRKNIELDFFTNCYYYLRKNNDFFNKIQKIKDNPIQLQIHKRKDILNELMKLEICQSSPISVKKFIEYFLMYSFQKLEFILLQSYVQIDDFKNVSENELIFTYYSVLNEEHEYYFINKSKYIPYISYYGEYDDNLIKKHLYKKNSRDGSVSFYTNYPNEIKLIYGDIKIYEKNLENDLSMIQILMEEDSIEKVIVKIQNHYSYIDTDIIQNKYMKKDYKLSIEDLYLLASIYNCGFTVYSNDNNKNEYQLSLIFNESIFKKDKNEIKFYNFYLNKDENKMRMIGTQEQLLSELFERSRFKKYMKQYYLKYYKIINEMK